MLKSSSASPSLRLRFSRSFSRSAAVRWRSAYSLASAKVAASERLKYSVRSEGTAVSIASRSGWSARGAAASCRAEPAKSADHGRAGRQVEDKRDGQTGGAGQRAGDPADCELSCRRRGKHDANCRRNDEKRKHQQHAGNRDRACYDHPKTCVEHELPEQASRSGQLPAQQPVQQPDYGVQRNDDGNFIQSAGQNIPG